MSEWTDILQSVSIIALGLGLFALTLWLHRIDRDR
jgi:hypothetical protein